MRPRFGVSLPGGGGFRAIAGLIGSGVEYRRMDALDVRELGERFDFVLCFGILESWQCVSLSPGLVLPVARQYAHGQPWNDCAETSGGG